MTLKMEATVTAKTKTWTKLVASVASISTKLKTRMRSRMARVTLTTESTVIVKTRLAASAVSRTDQMLKYQA
jgi:hypothetical protein